MRPEINKDFRDVKEHLPLCLNPVHLRDLLSKIVSGEFMSLSSHQLMTRSTKPPIFQSKIVPVNAGSPSRPGGISAPLQLRSDNHQS
jgi:hypothetical protein